MLNDIVIDTNVLMHAQNPDIDYFSDSIELLNTLLSCTTVICVDEGFSFCSATNRSYIAYEYFDKLKPGSFSYQFISALARSLRIKELPKNAERRAQKRIIQLIRKKRDRVFLGVACNSLERVLVSHDYEDFQQDKRKRIRSELEVSIVEAKEFLQD